MCLSVLKDDNTVIHVHKIYEHKYFHPWYILWGYSIFHQNNIKTTNALKGPFSKNLWSFSLFLWTRFSPSMLCTRTLCVTAAMHMLYKHINPGPEVIKLFSCSTQLSIKFFLVINLKLLTIANSFLLNIVEHEIFPANKFVGIFISISRENILLSWVLMTDISKCFSESLGIQDNESWLYMFKGGTYVTEKNEKHNKL